MKPFSFQAKISKWGNSHCIIVPYATVKMMGYELGEPLLHRMVRVEVTL